MKDPAFQLRRGPLALEVDRRGAVITHLSWTGAGGQPMPLLRAATAYAGAPSSAACFPLLPFGNRVAGNRFAFGGRTYDLAPNQPCDRHYLHGDGWLSEWAAEKSGPTAIVFTLTHAAVPGQPYAYRARLSYRLTQAPALVVEMEIRNDGSDALPFGLGLHPYFPLTPRTALTAPAEEFFAEAADFLPGARLPVPPDLDFARPRALPRRWINNGFTGWRGHARIVWPEAGLALHITAGPAFGDYFIFRPTAGSSPASQVTISRSNR